MKKSTNLRPYASLLSGARRRISNGPSGRTLSIEVASDRGRVLFSTGFRRLQSKTQVFPQEWNAAVRTRLTHSLEVASIGRFLGEGISERLLKQGQLGDSGAPETHQRASAFITFIEVACLMHDLGNPPFGHFGEASVQEWFKTRKNKYRVMHPKGLREEFNRLFGDFSYFDGNPQGFRLATRLQWVNDEFGYNLTYSQLAATLKYPWSPDRIGKIQNGVKIKKSSVFHSEMGILHEIQRNLNLSSNRRHPLTYVMEAADDISYCLSDIEDALEKKIVRDQDVVNYLRQKLVEHPSNGIVNKILSSLPKESINDSWFISFRTTVTNALVKRAISLYLINEKRIIKGEYFSLLNESVAAKSLLNIIGQFSKENLYCSSVVRERELVGYQVICGILDKFGLLLDLSSIEAQSLFFGEISPATSGMTLAPTLKSFLPRKHLKVYKHTVEEIKSISGITPERIDLLEWMARAHLIVDFLSGMTDDYAIVTYRRLYGGGSHHL